MFADNEKISVRQLGSLLFTDWIGKLFLILPMICSALPGWNTIAAVALGGAWTLLYAALLLTMADHVQDGFTDYMRLRLGRGFAYAVNLLYLGYLIVNHAYLARLMAKICTVFLLPEVSETLIALLVLLAGLATAAGSGQKRGRMGEFLAVLVGAALIIMLAALFPSVTWGKLSFREWNHPLTLLQKSTAVFAAFAGVGLLLYEAPYIRWTDARGKRLLRRMILGIVLLMLAAFVTALGVLGENGLSDLPWPLLTMMSAANLPGGFLQRWDAVFLAFLMFSLLMASGTASHYEERILREMLPKQKEKYLRLAASGAVLLLLLGSGNYETMAWIFSTWVLYGLVPLIMAVPFLLLALERVKKRCRKCEE